MSAPRVWAFFYGSYMNLEVLAEVGLVPERWAVARLAGYDLRIAPRANLVPAPGQVVYGIVATLTHEELGRLYAHARDVLGEVYLPEPVVATLRDGSLRPALCYLAHAMRPAPADPAYVERIAGPARRLGFPLEYVERIESFSTPDVMRHVQAAYALDGEGREAEAVVEYDVAFRLGVPEDERRGFLLGYGSTLKNVGRLEESEGVLRSAIAAYPDDRALPAFLALTLHARGRSAEAIAVLLETLVRFAGAAPEIERYQRAMAEYAAELVAPEG